MKLHHTLLLVLLLNGCKSNTTNITGKWFMHQVIREGKDVTSEHDPYNERYLVLKADSTFETGGRPYGENTGQYVYNAEEQTLFLDSDAGPEDDSYWKVSISGDTMTWQGYGSAWAEDFKLVQVRE